MAAEAPDVYDEHWDVVFECHRVFPKQQRTIQIQDRSKVSGGQGAGGRHCSVRLGAVSYHYVVDRVFEKDVTSLAGDWGSVAGMLLLVDLREKAAASRHVKVKLTDWVATHQVSRRCASRQNEQRLRFRKPCKCRAWT